MLFSLILWRALEEQRNQDWFDDQMFWVSWEPGYSYAVWNHEYPDGAFCVKWEDALDDELFEPLRLAWANLVTVVEQKGSGSLARVSYAYDVWQFGTESGSWMTVQPPAKSSG